MRKPLSATKPTTPYSTLTFSVFEKYLSSDPFRHLITEKEFN